MKPRIIHIIDNFQRGGAEVSLLEILCRITEFEIVVYALYNRNNDLKEEFVRRGIRVECLDLASGYLALFRTHRYRDRLKAEKPVLIHSTLFKADIFSRSVAKALNVPLVNSFVNNTYDSRRYSAENWKVKMKVRVLQWMDQLTARRVDRFLSNSAAIRDSNCTALGIDFESTKVIPRGRVVPVWSERDETVRHELQRRFFGRSGLCFMNTGRLIERKGQGDLLVAFAHLCKRHPEAFLVIAGEGPFRKVLEQRTGELHITNRVLFTGLRSDVPRLLGAADFFVFPSWYEGLPGSLVEAMLAGVPVICSDIPEHLECTGDTALLHQVRNPKELAVVMQKAIDFSDWPSYTKRAYHRACEFFDIDAVVHQYEQFYIEVLKTRSAR